jgi:predicted metal-dependent HD superfamily phosphohydrolase
VEISNKHESPRERAVKALIARGVETVIKRYGPGSPDPMPYHGPEHTLMVITSAGRLADAALAAGKITREQHDLLMIAAAFHDVVQDQGADNELLSAELAARYMNMLGLFSEQEIDEVQIIISATRVKSVADSKIVQSAIENDYLTMLMADADLSSFGLPKYQYWDSARRFFDETHPGAELEGQALQTFIKDQLQIVGNHRYYTDEARHLFHCQPENLEFLKSLPQR